MKKIFYLILLGFTSNVFSQCTDLFFSEYLEGTSNNKALEIYNPTSSAVNLAGYIIYRSNNGSPVYQDSLFLSGTIPAGGVYVVGNPSAVAAILAVSDTLHTVTFFNGDDVLHLRHNGILLDVIGELGVDPGTNWPVGSGATSEFTLVRMASIQQGNTNWTINATEWDVYPQNEMTHIGNHTMTPCCIAPVASVQGQLDADCNGDSTGMATVQGGPDTSCTYQWFPYGGTNDTAFNLAAGTFTCIVTNACGSDTVSVIISEPTPLAASLNSATDETCNASNGNLSINVGGGTPGYSYNWLSGGTTSTITNLDGGSYHCDISDTNGCTTTFDHTILDIPPTTVTLSLAGTDSVCSDALAITLSGESPLGGTFTGPGVSANQFTPSGSSLGWNVITYSYTDTNSCIGMDTDSIFVEVCSNGFEESHSFEANIYPNPTSGKLIIQVPEEIAAAHPKLEIITILGEAVITLTLNKANQEINIGSLENGMYVIRITGAHQVYSQAIIKKD